MSYSVLQNYKQDKHFFEHPYPHIIIPKCLPQETYELLYESFPVEIVKKNFQLVEEHTYRGLANDFIRSNRVNVHNRWKDFFEFHTSREFYNQVLNIFEPYIKNYSWIKDQPVKVRHSPGETKIVTDTQFVIHNPTKVTTRTDHIDNPAELYAGLLYFRQRGDISTGGDFVIYETKEVNEVYANTGREVPKDVEKKESKVIKYKDNAFVMFLNSNKAVHGVTPRVNAMHDRLSINIIAEMDKKVNPPFRLSDIAQ